MKKISLLTIITYIFSFAFAQSADDVKSKSVKQERKKKKKHLEAYLKIKKNLIQLNPCLKLWEVMLCIVVQMDLVVK